MTIKICQDCIHAHVCGTQSELPDITLAFEVPDFVRFDMHCDHFIQGAIAVMSKPPVADKPEVPAAKQAHASHYAPRICTQCGKEYAPRGPRQQRCLECAYPKKSKKKRQVASMVLSGTTVSTAYSTRDMLTNTALTA